jgi:hypothetical protein
MIAAAPHKDKPQRRRDLKIAQRRKILRSAGFIFSVQL